MDRNKLFDDFVERKITPNEYKVGVILSYNLLTCKELSEKTNISIKKIYGIVKKVISKYPELSTHLVYPQKGGSVNKYITPKKVVNTNLDILTYPQKGGNTIKVFHSPVEKPVEKSNQSRSKFPEFSTVSTAPTTTNNIYNNKYNNILNNNKKISSNISVSISNIPLNYNISVNNPPTPIVASSPLPPQKDKILLIRQKYKLDNVEQKLIEIVEKYYPLSLEDDLSAIIKLIKDMVSLSRTTKYYSFNHLVNSFNKRLKSGKESGLSCEENIKKAKYDIIKNITMDLIKGD